MLSKSKSVVGLDIGSSAVKAIELVHHGKDVMVSAFGQVEVPEDDVEGRLNAIKGLLTAGGFRSKRVVTAVSGKNVIVRYLSMVRMSDEELRNAIVFEAEKYVPFPLDECIVDCQRLDDDDDPRKGGNMSVLLVAVKRAQLDEHLKLASATGVTPEIVDVDAFALGNAHALCRAQAPAESGESTAVAFVDVGAAKTSVNVVVDGTSLFTREISMGGNEFTAAIARALNVGQDEAEELKRNPNEQVAEAVFSAIDDLGNEIQLSFDYFEDQFQKEVGRILLSGGGARLAALQPAFERIFEKPTSVFNPFTYLAVDGGIDADLLACNAPQLVTAVGLAARLQRI